MIVIVVIALLGVLASRNGRWRSERRSGHGEAMNRLRDLAHRNGVEESRGSPVVPLAPSVLVVPARPDLETPVIAPQVTPRVAQPGTGDE